MLLPVPICFSLFSLVLGANVLESPRITNWGDWQGWKRCAEGTYAAGMEIKSEGDQGGGDDTGLNSVALYCLRYNWRDYGGVTWIASGDGLYGSWQGRKYCPTGQLVIGFQLRSERNQKGGDDVAADNFAAYCGSPFEAPNRDNWIMGDTPGWGDWTSAQFCPRGHAVCAINSQIEGDQRGGDDTSLNNVDVECCPVTYSCVPDAHWRTIDAYSNVGGAGMMTYRYKVTSSMTHTESETTTMSWSEKNTISQKITSELGGAYSGLSMKLSNEFGISHEYAKSRGISSMVQDTVTHTTEREVSIQVPIGKTSVLKQLFFTCGGYEVGTAETSNSQY